MTHRPPAGAGAGGSGRARGQRRVPLAGPRRPLAAGRPAAGCWRRRRPRPRRRPPRRSCATAWRRRRRCRCWPTSGRRWRRRWPASCAGRGGPTRGGRWRKRRRRWCRTTRRSRAGAGAVPRGRRAPPGGAGGAAGRRRRWRLDAAAAGAAGAGGAGPGGAGRGGRLRCAPAIRSTRCWRRSQAFVSLRVPADGAEGSLRPAHLVALGALAPDEASRRFVARALAAGRGAGGQPVRACSAAPGSWPAARPSWRRCCRWRRGRSRPSTGRCWWR